MDGFGRAQWQTALGTATGDIESVTGNPAGGQITIMAPDSQLGTIGPGWVVTGTS